MQMSQSLSGMACVCHASYEESLSSLSSVDWPFSETLNFCHFSSSTACAILREDVVTPKRGVRMLLDILHLPAHGLPDVSLLWRDDLLPTASVEGAHVCKPDDGSEV